ncbi:MAG: preprotein translocase subunit SecA [Syntrophomonadaceae bacterium]|nr:preprotein translocase subunit SecA [Thermoanaerobacterales bacterium]NLN22012.1 preprotein translocase subunit SecA [Syntrophomonadaceae bacterium]
MLNALKNLFDDNAREVKRLKKIVDIINSWEPEIKSLTDDALRSKTDEFKERIAQGETLDEILPEAFAVVREASFRVLGMRPYDVQLMGGIVLHQGRIAEMKTGEGKTLVATMPAYLNALTGKGVHIVTVNDYLAKRDSEWMGGIFRFLGLNVGLIVHGLTAEERRKAYNADVIYGTNNEFGFDYLRDNMAMHRQEMVQRVLNYAIVDEVDSILIDEARTPLIISGQADKPTDLYYRIARVIPKLKKDKDYQVDEKLHTAALTEEGTKKVEELLGVQNLSDEDNLELAHHVYQGLRAHALMKRDRDYVVKDGQVIIVDEFTGRLMFGRRFSEGLHQAIEAKEGVRIERESQTLATITFQNYFRMYEKLAGMTGTAATEEDEFRKIYGLDVVVIPTHRPMIRHDYPDAIYRTEQGKFAAVVEEIAECYQRGQPVLVGTISIEKSEYLSKLLNKMRIPHQVLNAKFHEQEAKIVAQAGRIGMVTIATNMAGRGTDIILGGNPEFMAREELLARGVAPEIVAEASEYGRPSTEEVASVREEYRKLVAKHKKETDAEHEKVVALGGLHIIGTERHESRRIDNQLRGRAGRQGDPGSSRFYVSLEDDLMRLFGSDSISGIMDKLGMDDSVPVEHPLVTRSIESAQKKVENRNFEMRKHVLEYDDVMNQQREVIYGQRRRVLMGEDLRESLQEMISRVIDSAVERYTAEGKYPEEWDLEGLIHYGEQAFLRTGAVSVDELQELGTREEIKDRLYEEAMEHWQAREEELGTEMMRDLERFILLRVVDNKWMDHLDAMDQLRTGIGLRAYGQKDPLVEYKFEAYNMFQEMIEGIQEDVVRYLYKVRVVPQEQEQRVKHVAENYGDNGERTPVRVGKKIGRNDPCPCGSGRKYKRCCGRQD